MTPSEKQAQVGATFWDHISLIMRWRRLFTVGLTLVVIASIIYAFTAQMWYKSSSKVLPPPASSMGLGNLLPGLSMGALGAGSLLSNESNLALNILESRALRDAVIDTFHWMDDPSVNFRATAYTMYSELIKWELTEDGAISITVEEKSPQLAQETAQFVVDFLRREYTKISTAQAGQQREFIERRIDENYKAIEKAENDMMDFQKQTGVISVEDQLRASVEAVSKLSTELYLAEVEYDVYKKSLPPSSSEVIMARQRVASLKSKLNELNKKGENHSKDFFISINQGPEVGMQFFRLQRELETQGLILQFLLPQFEQTRIMELQDKSTMYILDPPNLPDKKSRPKRAFVVIGAFLGGFFFLFTLISFIEWVRRMQTVNPVTYENVQYILESTKPKRFFGKDEDKSEE